MTNNHIYIPERKWTFGVDGSITLPNQATLYEDEPGTLYIRAKGSTSINYSPYDLISDVPNHSVSFSSVGANSAGVSIGVDRKNSGDNDRQFSNWNFKDNGGLQFPDGSTQYGAYLDQEMMLDGGSAITVFPLTVTTPRFVEGGGSGSRYGTTSPNYDGGGGGANTNPNDFTLLLNGGGA